MILVICVSGIDGNMPSAAGTGNRFAEVTVVPVATAGPCTSPCKTIFPFLILLFFMTFVVAVTQMPLLMIVLRYVVEIFSFETIFISPPLISK